MFTPQTNISIEFQCLPSNLNICLYGDFISLISDVDIAVILDLEDPITQTAGNISHLISRIILLFLT